MAIIRTSEWVIEMEGASKHLLLTGVKDSELIRVFIEDKRDFAQEEPIRAVNQNSSFSRNFTKD